MSDKEFLSISEFAQLSGIRRKNLIFYDETGLFSPEHRGENGYRFYSYRQLDTANLIWALKEIGTSLAEIKSFMGTRTPEQMVALFKAKKADIENEIYKLQQIKAMMEAQIDITEGCLEVAAGEISLVERQREALFFGPLIDYAEGKTTSEAVAEFYDYCSGAGLVCSYPLGALVARKYLSPSTMAEECWDLPDRYYYKIPAGDGEKPAGLYACGYGRGDYGQAGWLYHRLLAFIQEKGLAVCGDAYEEYLLNEISIREPEDYLFRVEIPVKNP